ncbi:MAG: hypothetical protein U1G05_08220 [Kiritimatiellia bacterium]
MHGIFFEDINYAADGLYAELVQEPLSEHRDGMHAWRWKAATTPRGRRAGHGAAGAREQPALPCA